MTPVALRPNPRAGLVVGVMTVAYLPFTLLGYGTDIDVANVLRAGRSALDDHDYQLSRGPGAAVHEIATAALDKLGGSVAVNLASVAFAALALWCLHSLVRRDGARWPAWPTVVLATNPWFWIAATSLADFVWAIALVLAGAEAAQRDRRLLAGVLFGLAIGCRASSVLLIAAWLVAEGWGDRDRRVPWRATGLTLASTVAVGAACFVPPWLDAGRTLSFLDNELDFVGAGVHFGRWAVKNVAVVGVLAGAVLLGGVRHLFAALGRWSSSVVVRFSVLAIVAMEVLFYRLPFKPLHLLPVLVGIALLAGASPRVSQRFFVVLVAAQVVGGLVGTTIAAPDVEDAARAGEIELGITAGPLLTDVRCRLDDRDRGPWPDPDTLAAVERAGASSHCQAATWKAD